MKEDIVLKFDFRGLKLFEYSMAETAHSQRIENLGMAGRCTYGGDIMLTTKHMMSGSVCVCKVTLIAVSFGMPSS